MSQQPNEDEAQELQIVAPEPRGAALISVRDILTAAAESGRDPGTVREMYAFAKEVMKDQNQQEWTQSFVRAKMELDGYKIRKNGAIVYEGKNGKPDSTIKFLKYDDIAEAVKPILRKYNLVAAYDYEFTPSPPKTICVMKLMHVNGHVELFRSPPLPMVDSGGGKNDVQGAGSVGTYGRRYVVCPTFDIVAEGEDDDGNMGRDQPQPITDAELTTITDIVAACEDKNPGFRNLFTKWMVAELKVQQAKDLRQGNQLRAVMTKLDEKQRALGLKK